MIQKLKNLLIKPANAYIDAHDESKNEFPRNMDQVYKLRHREKKMEKPSMGLESHGCAIPKDYLKVIICTFCLEYDHIYFFIIRFKKI